MYCRGRRCRYAPPQHAWHTQADFTAWSVALKVYAGFPAFIHLLAVALEHALPFNRFARPACMRLAGAELFVADAGPPGCPARRRGLEVAVEGRVRVHARLLVSPGAVGSGTGLYLGDSHAHSPAHNPAGSIWASPSPSLDVGAEPGLRGCWSSGGEAGEPWRCISREPAPPPFGGVGGWLTRINALLRGPRALISANPAFAAVIARMSLCAAQP